jgi:hypothetical protein
MNTNQEVSSNAPTASSILSSFLGKKKVISEEKNEVASEPISEVKVSSAAEILNRLNHKKEKAAVNLGITTAEVETMPFDLSQLETEGIFLNVDCKGFSTLLKTISAACRTSARFLPPKIDASR